MCSTTYTQHACHWIRFSSFRRLVVMSLNVVEQKNFCYRNANSANGSANDFRNLAEIVYDLFKPAAHTDCLAFGMRNKYDDDSDDEKKIF